jgi:hypothetical protein
MTRTRVCDILKQAHITGKLPKKYSTEHQALERNKHRIKGVLLIHREKSHGYHGQDHGLTGNTENHGPGEHRNDRLE